MFIKFAFTIIGIFVVSSYSQDECYNADCGEFECISPDLCTKDGGIEAFYGSGIIEPRTDLEGCASPNIWCKRPLGRQKSQKPDLDSSQSTNKTVLKAKHCGSRIQKAIGVRRDSNLHVAEGTDFPWTLALLKNDRFICGASLLGPRVAVTVSHNIPEEWSSLVIRAGELDFSHEDELIEHQDRNITKVIKHPSYNVDGQRYDMALLIWDEPLDMSYANTNSICLPEKDENFDGLECVVTGWGSSVSSDEYSNEMKYLYLPIVNRTECIRKYKESSLGKGFRLHKSLLCAGGEAGRDTCKGDGGSPLACKFDGERYYKLAGLVSWGIRCGEERPAMYANVASSIDWITQEMNNNGVHV